MKARLLALVLSFSALFLLLSWAALDYINQARIADYHIHQIANKL